MESLLKSMKRYPVIAAVKDFGDMELAAHSNVQIIFLLGSNIMNLPEICNIAHRNEKVVFVHLDLCEGLGKDNAAVDWCATYIRPDGVISTKAPLLKRAAGQGLMTIQRLFLMDSTSIGKGISLLKKSPPDMVELLPGLIPKAITLLNDELECPIIAGGMVTEKQEVHDALVSGAVAVSTSEKKLWNP